MKPLICQFTNIFESQSLLDMEEAIVSSFNHFESELPIALTKIDDSNWTLLTTKQIISNISGELKHTLAEGVIHTDWNDFKGYKHQSTTVGKLTLKDDSTMYVLVETGKASMIMIYGIMTLTAQRSGG